MIRHFSRYKFLNTTLLKNVLLTLVSLFFTLFVLEIIYRIVWKTDFDYWMVGPSHSDQKWYYTHYDGNSMYRHLFVNFDPVKVNIWGVGDSFTFGEGVQDARELYLEKLRNRLRSHIPVEIINLAKGGYTIADIFKQILEYSQFISTDVILYGLNLNDIISPEVQSKLDKYSQRSLEMTWFAKRSYLCFDLFWRFDRVIENVKGIHYESIIKELYNDNSSDWRTFTEVLLAIKQLCKTKKIKLFVAILPLMTNFNDYPFQKANALIMNFCKIQGIDCFDTSPQFFDKDAKYFTVNPYDSHPNITAHTMIAEKIYIELSQKLSEIYQGLKRPSGAQKLSFHIVVKRDTSLVLNWDQAINFERSRIAEEPENSLYHFNLGIIYNMLAKSDSAEIEFNEAYNLQPNFILNLIQIIELAKQKKDYAKVLSLSNSILLLEPDNEYGLLSLSESYYIFKNYKNMTTILRKGIKYYPHNKLFHNHLINYYMNIKDFSNALKQLKVAQEFGVQIDPSIIRIIKEKVAIFSK